MAPGQNGCLLGLRFVLLTACYCSVLLLSCESFLNKELAANHSGCVLDPEVRAQLVCGPVAAWAPHLEGVLGVQRGQGVSRPCLEKQEAPHVSPASHPGLSLEFPAGPWASPFPSPEAWFPPS